MNRGQLYYIVYRTFLICQITFYTAYNYVDEPGHEKHWIVQIEPRQLDATAEEEIDRQNIFLQFH